ncbi:MAG: S8 family serine peptidase, partial [Alphaproteobacteria bacterium]
MTSWSLNDAGQGAEETNANERQFKYGEVIVRIDQDAVGDNAENAGKFAALQAALGAEVVSSTQKFGFELWRFDSSTTREAISSLESSDLAYFFEYVQPNYILTASSFEVTGATPNDSSFGLLWGLNNTGQLGGTVDADIDASEAWAVSTGAGVVVGVIDTGVDYRHPDLNDNSGKLRELGRDVTEELEYI